MGCEDEKHPLGRIATTVEEARGEARFVISAADRRARDRLLHLGYLPIGAGRFATRWFPRSAALRRYHERFASSIEEMVAQSARAKPVPWEAALEEALLRLEGSGLDWWLYGSGALAVRGLDVEPGDLDLNVDDANLAGIVFDDLLVTPVEEFDGWVARRGGRAFCHAIIEWISEPRPELDDPRAPTEQGPFVAGQLEVVQWRGHRLRVPPLSVQLRINRQRGLKKRAVLIQAAIGA